MKFYYCILALLLFTTPAAAEITIFTSTTERVHVIELFTSEGCSSCPPADRYLAELREHSDLWTRFIPLKFHVHYWDKLGWKDKLANSGFTRRQKLYSKQWQKNTIYTPCFVFDGKEWSNWRSRTLPTSSTKPPGVLSLRIRNGTAATVSFSPEAKHSEAATVSLALLGNSISSRISRGENSGEVLTHEFVVLKLLQRKVILNGSLLSESFSLSTDHPSLPPRLAVAAWISDAHTLAPIQATGGDLITGAAGPQLTSLIGNK